MTNLTRLLGCALLSAFAAYACGDDGSKASPGGAGEGGEGASAGERGNAAGSDGGGTENGAGSAGLGGSGDPSLGGSGSAGEAPQSSAGNGAGGADPASGEGGSGGHPDAASGGAGGVGGAGGAGGAGTCELGEAASAATNQALDLFGTVVYFDDGAELPAGRYRVTYLDGCMKYSSSQDWTIHAYANGDAAAWWLVGATSGDRIVVPPGTSGYLTSNGAHATFDACVAANVALDPIEFEFAGGKLGVWLLDSNYGDNVAGETGRNPKWKLTLLGDCVE